MAVFWICNLEASNFVFEDVRFERLSNEDFIKRSWAPEYNISFKAIADDDLAIKPIVQSNGLLGVINDICMLLSLAQSKRIYCSLYEIEGTSTSRHVTPGMSFGWSPIPVIPENNIEVYLSTAATNLRKQGWAKKVGFIPSVYFLLESMNAQVLDFNFISAWIALEILANCHVAKSKILASSKFKTVRRLVHDALDDEAKKGILSDKQKDLILQKVPELNRFSTRDSVMSLSEARGWDSVTDEWVGNLINIRNGILHSGTYKGFERQHVGQLYSQLAGTVQLMLIDLLGCSQFAEVSL